jgi:hypothetical protein
VRYVRLRAISPTYGAVTVVMVDAQRQDRFYVLCLDTALSGPQLIRRWQRRHWIEFVFRALKHLLATESCQGTAKTLLWTLGVTLDHELRVVLHVTRDLQGSSGYAYPRVVRGSAGILRSLENDSEITTDLIAKHHSLLAWGSAAVRRRRKKA